MAKQRPVVTIDKNHRAFVTLVSYVNSCGRYGERNVRLCLRYIRSNQTVQDPVSTVQKSGSTNYSSSSWSGLEKSITYGITVKKHFPVY